MNLYLIGKHNFSPNWDDNTLDIPLFERLAAASDQLVIIGCSSQVNQVTETIHGNITLVLLPASGFVGFLRGAVRQFALYHQRIPASVIGASEIGAGLASVCIKKRYRVPLLFMVQGDLLDLPSSHFSVFKRKILRRLTLFVAKRAECVRGVSQKIIDGLQQAGIAASKTKLLKNRVDLGRFNPGALAETRTALRATYGIADDAVCLTYLGALTVEKGFKEFVTVANALLQRHDHLHILIIGDGPLRRWGEETLGPFSAITWAGFVPQAEVQNPLAAGDIYLFTSHHEGMPRVVLEYMAMGKPVIATPVGGIAEVIKDGRNGLLADVGDTHTMISHVTALLESPSHRADLGAAARDTVETHHDLEATIADQIRTYKEMATPA